jgi:hypothetical protein
MMRKTNSETPPSSSLKQRKPRGEHIEQTAFMQSLEDNPAGAMAALADEAEQEWQQHAPKEFKGLLEAAEDEPT